MSASDFQFTCLLDPRLAAYATSALPAWLWRTDGSEVLWANPNGAALFGAASPTELAAQPFAADAPARREIASLAATLPDRGAPRLAQLPFDRNGQMLSCTCSRISVDGEAAVLVTAMERAGPALPLDERTRRLLAACDAPVAAFGSDGKLLHATAAIADALGGATDLAALGGAALIADAVAHGRASGAVRNGTLSLARIGQGASTVLLATIDVAQSPPAAAAVVAEAPVQEHVQEPVQEHVQQHVQEHAQEPVQALTQELIEEPVMAAEPPATASPEPEAQASLTESKAEPQTEPESAEAAARHNDADDNGVDADAEPKTLSDAAAPVVAAATAGQQLPLRFVWQTDADNRFTLSSDEFIRLIGPVTASAFGRAWSEIDAELKIDRDGDIGRALASRETWSSIVVDWPVDGSDERLPVDLSGLPVFDRERVFRGYRGFGICRDVERLEALATARALVPSDATPVTPAITATPTPTPTPTPTTPERAPDNNVLRFRPAPVQPEQPPALNPVERSNFRELARRLTDQLKKNGDNEDTAPAAEESDFAVMAAQPPERTPAAANATAASERPILDRLPLGILVYRLNDLLYANAAFLEWTGYADLQDLADAGGLDTLFIDMLDTPGGGGRSGKRLAITTQNGKQVPVEGRLFSTTWKGENALVLMLNPAAAGAAATAAPARGEDATALAQAEERLRELEAFWKRSEDELIAAKRQAERASTDKAAFVAKVSHEIRTPLNAIIGFSEMMMQQKFGPIGNDRYLEYLTDIHDSGSNLIALLDELVDLSKIEAGKRELTFADVDLNDIVQESVAIMQPQASRDRVIIRTALNPSLGAVVADPRAVRQIVLNLLNNSVKFTPAGGQIIVSTAAEGQEAILRVRDTGAGMSKSELAHALEPFQQLSTTPRGSNEGVGLGLPITKALAEANRARFHITSEVDAGTLVEVAFPERRIAAE